MAQSNVHITNINGSLKGIKSEVVVNFIRSDNKGIIVTTNKVVAILLRSMPPGVNMDMG